MNGGFGKGGMLFFFAAFLAAAFLFVWAVGEFLRWIF